MSRSNVSRWLAAISLAALLLPVNPGAAAAQQSAAYLPPGQTITLVTGDIVQVREYPDGTLDGDVVPAPGRESIPFLRESGGKQLHIIPGDAARRITTGKLDPRLFDIGYLLHEGYAGRADVPVIVQPPHKRAKTDRIRRDNAASFWKNLPDGKVWLDAKVHVTLDQSVPQIGAPAAWQAGFDGSGVTVAVLDTGVDRSHPDLAAAVIEAKDFTGTKPDASDGHGHGTHVASTIAGRGTPYTGVAKHANLVVGKVLADNGSGEWSWVIDGMEWAAKTMHAKVISMSLGATDTPGIDPIEEAVNRLTAETGALFVIASGNSGPQPGTANTPGTADAALTVGAVDKQDVMAAFSGRGPRLGDYAVKPDITAPGVGIVAAKAGGGYIAMSGTSMATPHVAGVAALVTQQHPDWTAQQIKTAIAGSSHALSGQSAFATGAGRVDAAAVTREQVFANDASVSLGFVPFPYADTEPRTAPVSFRNTSTTQVTLNLALAMTDQAGQPAPAGMFGVTPTQITIPANATASATVSFAAGAGPAGTYSGAVTATGDGHTARIALGAIKEPEGYDITINALDRNGNIPTTALFNTVTFFNYATGTFVGPVPSGTKVHLPTGEWAVNSYISTARAGSPYPNIAQMSIASLKVDHNQVVTLDSRAAPRVSFTVDDRPNAATQYRYIHMLVKNPPGNAIGYFSWTLGATKEIDEVYVSGQGQSDKFAFAAQGHLTDDQSSYHLFLPTTGSVPSNVDFHVSTPQLGAVSTKYHGINGRSVVHPGALFAHFGRPMFHWWDHIEAPARRTEYFSAGITHTQTADPYVWTDWRTLKAGELRRDVFNTGILGPSLDGRPQYDYLGNTRPSWAFRNGNVLDVRIPMLVDGGRNHLAPWSSPFPHTGYTRLYRDGVLIGTSAQPARGQFAVPSARGTYTLEASDTYGPLTAQSVWTFQSATSTEATALPLTAVRFTPDLNDENRATAGALLAIPIRISQQSGASTEITSLTVEISYDEGTTWAQVPAPGKLFALVKNPASGTVSLRATATDTAGNTVRQTLLRAYAV